VNTNVLYSDEMLNAYIDDELHHDDYVTISAALTTDHVLRARIEKLRVVHSLVQVSYRELEMDDAIYLKSRFLERTQLALAASLFLMVGALLGWMVNHYYTSPSLFDMAHTIENRTSAKAGKSNIMLHLSSDNPYRWKVVLDEIEQALVSASTHHSDLQVHLVTHGKAIKVAQLEKNPFADRIQHMMKKYPNFTIQVCRQTLERMYYSKNKSVKLLPGAEIVRSALGEIIKKRQQGWLYLKI